MGSYHVCPSGEARVAVGDSRWVNAYIFKDGRLEYGTHFPSRDYAKDFVKHDYASVEPVRAAWRVRVIKRDPSTYLDRLLAAGEWRVKQFEAGGSMWASEYRKLARLYERQRKQRPAPTKVEVTSVRPGGVSLTVNAKPASMTDAVADAMLKGVL